MMEVIITELALKCKPMFNRKIKDIVNCDVYDCDIVLVDVEGIKILEECIIITFKDLGYSYPVTLFKKDFHTITIM